MKRNDDKKLSNETPQGIIDIEMKNIVGLNAGLMSSVLAVSGKSESFFMPMIGLSVLNIQVGLGYAV